MLPDDIDRGPVQYWLTAEYIMQDLYGNQLFVREWTIGRIGEEKFSMTLLRPPIEGETGRALPWQISQPEMRLKNKYSHIESPMVQES